LAKTRYSSDPRERARQLHAEGRFGGRQTKKPDLVTLVLNEIKNLLTEIHGLETAEDMFRKMDAGLEPPTSDGRPGSRRARREWEQEQRRLDERLSTMTKSQLQADLDAFLDELRREADEARHRRQEMERRNLDDRLFD
jgi:hypothetical protein